MYFSEAPILIISKKFQIMPIFRNFTEKCSIHCTRKCLLISHLLLVHYHIMPASFLLLVCFPICKVSFSLVRFNDINSLRLYRCCKISIIGEQAISVIQTYAHMPYYYNHLLSILKLVTSKYS